MIDRLIDRSISWFAWLSLLLLVFFCFSYSAISWRVIMLLLYTLIFGTLFVLKFYIYIYIYIYFHIYIYIYTRFDILLSYSRIYFRGSQPFLAPSPPLDPRQGSRGWILGPGTWDRENLSFVVSHFSFFTIISHINFIIYCLLLFVFVISHRRQSWSWNTGRARDACF